MSGTFPAPGNGSAGARFRAALRDETPLQIVGTVNANHALLTQRAGFRAIYMSGGGVAAGSLGMPDLGILNLDDVLVDVRRITDVCPLPLLVDDYHAYEQRLHRLAGGSRSPARISVSLADSMRSNVYYVN